MPVSNEGLEKEMGYITKPTEIKHIRGLFENTDPLMHDMAYALITGDQHEVDRLTKQALDSGFTANAILDDGLISGMAVIGIKFRDNIIFVPEVLVAARAMPAGTIVMGTVKGDLHDIGKNLCIMMLRGAGFIVHDLGVDTAPDAFIDAVMEHEAQVLGMSALLTTTMPNMGKTIDAFEEAGIRYEIKIMLGGAPLNQSFADDMGADGYGKDAIDCVDLAKNLIDQLKSPEAATAVTSDD